MDRKVVDLILVPMGILAMVSYHIWLLYRIFKHPTKTVIGFNAINRRFWVRAMMEDVSKNGVLSVQTLRNNIMASTLLATMAIMLSSIIAVLMTNGNKSNHNNDNNDSNSKFFVFGSGDRTQTGLSIKFFCMLSCFLVAFFLNVQSIRYYSHASILINVPFQKISPLAGQSVDYVAWNVNRGSFFWSLGLRAFYFSLPLFLWIFGPIPMFVSCLVLVVLLYFLDVTSFECKWVVGVSEDHKRIDKEKHGINHDVELGNNTI